MKNIEIKRKIISKYSNIFNDINSLIFINSNKLNSNIINDIRKVCYKFNYNVIYIKNSLLKKSFINTKFEILNSKINFYNMILYSNNNIFFILKKIYNLFDNTNNGIKFVFTENKFFDLNNVKFLYSLDTYEKSIIKFINIINNISIKKVINIFYIIKKVIK